MLFIFLVFLPLLQHACASVTVVTSKGPIVGQRATDGNYTTFFGVPYAQVDERHPFENTLEYPNFSTPFNASDPTIKCPQAIITETGVRQCLRLNMYVPAGISGPLPVFVWFHGGGLAFGSAGEYNATHLVQAGIIVVTANYRLGPYGFLCTCKIKNQGLKDMKNALKWINRHIGSFGGDPNKVTIAGESWGGSAVDFLLYEDGIFNQAIIQSGARFSYAVSSRVNNEAPIRLAAILGYNTTKYKDAIRYLNTADPIKVMKAYNQYNEETSYVFGLCEKHGDFHLNLKAQYADKIKNTPIMIGVTSKETFYDIASQNDSYYATVEDNFYKSFGSVFDLKNETLRQLANIVWKFYLGEKTISKESMLEIIDLSSDFQENYGTERSVTNFLRLGNPKVYKYVYSYIGESPYKNVTGVGAYHTQELDYIFEWMNPLKTEEQFRMRRWLVKLWTNFVKYGDPTPDNSEGVRWQPTNLSTRPYLDIDLKSKMGYFWHHKRMSFWELLWTAYSRYRK